jgi:hypothetical protein
VPLYVAAAWCQTFCVTVTLLVTGWFAPVVPAPLAILFEVGCKRPVRLTDAEHVVHVVRIDVVRVRAALRDQREHVGDTRPIPSS